LVETVQSVLALDYGGTQLRTAVAYSDRTLAGRRATRTPTTAREVVEASAAQLKETISEARDPRPTELAISAPGPLDPFNGILLTPPNLDRSLWDFPLAAALRDALGVTTVMERDTQVAVLAEGEFGAAQAESDYVYLTVSTGIGGGVVTDGRLLRGADGLAGELGHLTVDYNGPVCGCGMRGHLEAISSGTGIARRARAAGLGAEGGGAPIDARRVAELEDEGNAQAHQLMDDARRSFAAAIVAITDVFNPSVIVVGGGIAIAQGERLLAPARAALRQSRYSHQARRVRILPAVLGDDVGLIGGLSLVRLARLGDHVASGRSGLGSLGADRDARTSGPRAAAEKN
jgi:glucokinase